MTKITDMPKAPFKSAFEAEKAFIAIAFILVNNHWLVTKTLLIAGTGATVH